MRSMVEVTGNENVKIRCSSISLSKVDRFTSNQDQNDQWSIPHMSSDSYIFTSENSSFFCDNLLSVIIYKGGLHVAVLCLRAYWRTYLDSLCHAGPLSRSQSL